MNNAQLTVKEADNGKNDIEVPIGELRVSVRRLVEFLLRSGDIDNRYQGSPENAMQEGSRIHRMLQKRMGADYRAEVSLTYRYAAKEYELIIEGRADGILDNPDQTMVDEIKGTYRDIERMRHPVPVHVAQAKCYAYMYAAAHKKETIRIRMTYCNIETEDIRYFYEEYTIAELKQWFDELICEYLKWADYDWHWRIVRQHTLETLEFPFPYREGQKELVSYVYQTIFHQKKLFIEAPTGVGKTISTIFPAMKAMGRNKGDKFFYLTAKTITRTVADDTIELLREQGLRFKSIVLTAKEKICFTGETKCDPEHCPFAKGHFDRINDAVYDLLTHEDRFGRDKIEQYAQKHMVCPFEMGLDMSLFADGIICDYNYLFDPHVYLKRFFESGDGEYLFLIDEAHNLLERGREMYSAGLIKEEFLELKREIHNVVITEKTETKDLITNDIETESGENQQLTLQMTGLSIDMSRPKKRKNKKNLKEGKSRFVLEGYARKMESHLETCNKQLLLLKRGCDTESVVCEIDGFVNALLRLYNSISDYLEIREQILMPVREQILELYFKISHFLVCYEKMDENYVKYVRIEDDGTFLIKLLCVNPRENLKECMLRGRSAILFSATMLPIQYYKELLGGEKEDYEVYAKSVFDAEKQMLFIAKDVTSRYVRRSREEYYKIAAYIDRIVSGRNGNYLVFFPSHAFLNQVYMIFREEFQKEGRELLIQQEAMKEAEKEAFLARFRGNEECDMTELVNSEIQIDDEDCSLIGFCVLGGIFGEGIDLKNDSLIGAVIVGTGMPQVCFERELLKKYFDEKGENGFDYAYRYPGMNKVLQAAGRVIRTQEDVGIVALLDDRFLQRPYKNLFPREWENCGVVDLTTLEHKLERFWDSWGKYSG